MIKYLYLPAAVLALSVYGPQSMAQDGQSQGAARQASTVESRGMSPGRGKPSDNTNMYVSQAAIGDLFEVQSSELALKKAQSAEVRAFARHMIAEHTATTAQLKTLASRPEVGRVLPTEVDAPHKAMLDQLKAASGAAFDQVYLTQQAQAHQKALLLHSDYAENGKVDAAKSFAQMVTPKIRQHGEMLKKLQSGTATAAH